MTEYLTTNTKVSKDVDGFELLIMQLAPVKVAKHRLDDGSVLNTCPDAGACAKTCIFSSGRGVSKSVFDARVWRTVNLIATDGTINPVALAQIELELAKAVRSANKRGKRLAVRLNGFSDLDFVALLGREFFARWFDVQWYDYTKSFERWQSYLAGKLPANYDLTFSVSEKRTLSDVMPIITKQHARPARCAVVSRNPKSLISFGAGVDHQYVDGDMHDATFTWPTGTILVLAAKGKGGSRNPEATAFIPA